MTYSEILKSKHILIALLNNWDSYTNDKMIQELDKVTKYLEHAKELIKNDI